MEKWVILALTFLLLLSITWTLLLLMTRQPTCPEEIRDKHFQCESTSDCYYHPLYECVSSEPECTTNKDLTTQQATSRLLTCECVKGECITKVKK